MKKVLIFLSILLCNILYSYANVTITVANGNNLCTNAYNTLGNIRITEGANSDISIQNNKTLKLTSPTGFEFNPGVGSVSCTAGRNISAISLTSVTTTTITITFTCNGVNASDRITISGIQVKASDECPIANDGNILRVSTNPGTATISGITNNVTNFGLLTQWESSSAISQTLFDNITIGSVDNEIIRIRVTGGCLPSLVTSFSLNTSGSTNPLADISVSKIYYTGSSTTFSTTNLFGSAATPSGTYTINGTQTLLTGNNYFWVAYNIASGSTLTHVVDAQCTSVTIGGCAYTPSPTTVDGFRGISRCPTNYMEDGLNVVVNGDFESGNSGFTSNYGYVANDPNPTIRTELWPEGYYSVWSKAKDLHYMWSDATKGHGGIGNFMIVNGNTVNNIPVWTQTVSTTINTNYYFCAWLCSVHPTNPAQLSFSINGVNVGSTYVASIDTVNHWDEFYATWNSGAITTATISIVNKNTIASGNDFGLDDISFVPCCTSTMPIELLSFNAEYEKNKVNIFWTTVSEINNHFFSIEKSKDNKSYDILQLVKGAGNSNNEINYAIYDTTPYIGITYYKLKQTDYDGKETSFGPICIKIYDDGSAISVYPNPVKSNNATIFIKNIKSGKVNISLYDINGKLVFEKNYEIENDGSLIDIDLNNFENGTYILNIIGGTINFKTKIVKTD